MKVAFIVASFPSTSETFIINQVADLEDRGIKVDIYSFKKGDSRNVTQRYVQHEMYRRTKILAPPRSILIRILLAPFFLIRLALLSPQTLWLLVGGLGEKGRIREILSLKYLYWTAPFVGKKYDLVHCHFGTVATKYVRIRALVGDKAPLVTTLYGYDISHTIQQKGPAVYNLLHEVCSNYIVMSENMQTRAIAHGFPRGRITVLPVSIAVKEYPFSIRSKQEGKATEIITVARLVEKKGIDDLLQAAAVLKKNCKESFHITIIGAGPLEESLMAISEKLEVVNEVSFTGHLPLEEVNRRLADAHVYVQPSKTALNGDME